MQEFEVQTDCKLYDREQGYCRGLKHLYCGEEKCKFFKPRNTEDDEE